MADTKISALTALAGAGVDTAADLLPKTAGLGSGGQVEANALLTKDMKLKPSQQFNDMYRSKTQPCGSVKSMHL